MRQVDFKIISNMKINERFKFKIKVTNHEIVDSAHKSGEYRVNV